MGAKELQIKTGSQIKKCPPLKKYLKNKPTVEKVKGLLDWTWSAIFGQMEDQCGTKTSDIPMRHSVRLFWSSSFKE